ncbi:MAG: hypothetical protein M3168_02370 [Actinomycetota bacterium]|nr:hypothetical protein [Actinomycetota bacterium]
MAEPFIFTNTYALKEGKLGAFEEAIPEWLEFLETNHPRLLHFGVYSNGEREVTAVQVHPDVASMEQQMQLISGRHEGWYQFIDWSKMRVEVHGTPSNALLEQMGQVAGPGVPLTVKRPLGGFSRLPEL